MGFFSELKEDLSQAVNELMPEEKKNAKKQEKGIPQTGEESYVSVSAGPENETEMASKEAEMVSLEEMLQNIDSIQVPEDTEEPKSSGGIMREEGKGENYKMDNAANKQIVEGISIIAAGMTVTGNISLEGPLEVAGTVNGDIDIRGKLNVVGCIAGNSSAEEVYAEGATIRGEIVSSGAVKIGASSVVIGNITATSAAIAGAVRGHIDVKGPVVLDASAIVLGNIKSKSLQINNGALVEGMCSQCYSDVSPYSFFEEYKEEDRKETQKETGDQEDAQNSIEA
nr:polymer-forming cytoskeletal protein [uncultured Acetatifactor sp.]